MVLAFFSGILRILLGLLGMGFLANFLSHSVISGFTSAAGIMICLSQVCLLSWCTPRPLPQLHLRFVCSAGNNTKVGLRVCIRHGGTTRLV